MIYMYIIIPSTCMCANLHEDVLCWSFNYQWNIMSLPLSHHNTFIEISISSRLSYRLSYHIIYLCIINGNNTWNKNIAWHEWDEDVTIGSTSRWWRLLIRFSNRRRREDSSVKRGEVLCDIHIQYIHLRPQHITAHHQQYRAITCYHMNVTSHLHDILSSWVYS